MVPQEQTIVKIVINVFGRVYTAKRNERFTLFPGLPRAPVMPITPFRPLKKEEKKIEQSEWKKIMRKCNDLTKTSPGSLWNQRLL